MDEQMVEVIQQLMGWHERQVTDLQTIVDATQVAEIRMGPEGGENDLVLSGDKAKGFRIGVAYALTRLGKLPISLTATSDDELDDDA